MWMKILLGVLIGGLILNLAGYVLIEGRDRDPPPVSQVLGEKQDAWRDVVGIVLVWVGRAMSVVGGAGLFVMGVRRSTFIGRPGY